MKHSNVLLETTLPLMVATQMLTVSMSPDQTFAMQQIILMCATPTNANSPNDEEKIKLNRP